MRTIHVMVPALFSLLVPATALAETPAPRPLNGVMVPPTKAPEPRPLNGIIVPATKPTTAPTTKPLDGIFLPGKGPTAAPTTKPLNGIFMPGKGPGGSSSPAAKPNIMVEGKDGTFHGIHVKGTFQPRTTDAAPKATEPKAAPAAGDSSPAAAKPNVMVPGKDGTYHEVHVKGTFQPRTSGAQGKAGEAEAAPPGVTKVADQIYAANTTNETHRINGPQVLYGATKAADGTLTMVQLNPGTKGYDAAKTATDFRLNGSPPIFSPSGEVVFQPHNTPL